MILFGEWEPDVTSKAALENFSATKHNHLDALLILPVRECAQTLISKPLKAVNLSISSNLVKEVVQLVIRFPESLMVKIVNVSMLKLTEVKPKLIASVIQLNILFIF
jgi:hypothetical protein